MMEINQETAKKALAVTLLADAPGMLWGMPGVGKSSFVRTIAEKLNYEVVVLIGSLMDPTDLKGMPYIARSDDSTFVDFARPYFIVNATKRPTLLFFDELNLAPKAVRDACLRIVLEKAIDEIKLPPHTRVLAASNPPEVSQGWELSMPLANRFVHIQFPVPSAPSLASYFRTKEFNIDEEIAERLSAVWENDQSPYIAKWSNTISVYLEKVNPAEVFRSPKEGTEFPDNLAYPTPRSWEFAMKLLAAADIYEASPLDKYSVSDLHLVVVAGAIGFAAARQLINWLQNLDVPDTFALLEGKAKFPTREDIQFLVLNNIVSLFRSKYEEVGKPSKTSGAENILTKILSFVNRLYNGESNLPKRPDLAYLTVSLLNSFFKERGSTIGEWLFDQTRPSWVPKQFVSLLHECVKIKDKISTQR